jgi:hypothetical protein
MGQCKGGTQDKLKALSGYAEWFWLMAKNLKDVENRDWSLFRYFTPGELPVRVYLHASKQKTPGEDLDFIYYTLEDYESAQEFDLVDWDRYRGALIGEVTITGQTVYHVNQATMLPTKRSVWQFGPYCFWVKDGVLYERPIPMLGQLGFWEVNFEKR